MNSLKSILLFYVIVINVLDRKTYAARQFPDKFQLGVATSSYQIEGGWNASGKGENIWDRLTRTTNFVTDGSTGDIACDSYNQHKRDVEILKELGVDFYRFSLSWSRILPDGYATRVNDDGIRYYNELINDLLTAGITPSITLYHWDLPQALQEIGGWLNPDMPKYFADFAAVAFNSFGDRVKTWLTLNEPWDICVEGYGGTGKAPALDKAGIADYQCSHNLLKGHAEVYHLYDRVYRPAQNGRVGLSLSSGWKEPATDSAEDREAADIAMQFILGWFAQPIFTQQGDYPDAMKERIKTLSLEQGFAESRLPEFTPEEIDFMKGTADFFGLNHYSTAMVKMPTNTSAGGLSYWEDLGMITYADPSWPTSASDWLKVVPWGFRKLLNWIKNEYNNPEIIVFENGYSDRGELDDMERVKFYNEYLNAMLDAIEDGVDVSGYTAWSLMDNFEWEAGYTERFGIYHVDFNDPARPRTPKTSALYFKDIMKTKTIEENNDNLKNYSKMV